MKCPLRKKIEEAIADEPNNPESAALRVCAVLEDSLDLESHGWWDGDEEVSAAIENFDTQRLADIESGKYTQPGDEEYING